MALRATIYHYLQVEDGDRGGERALNIALSVLIVCNLLAVVFETVEEYRTAYGFAFLAFERFSLAVFSTEYLLRFWSCAEDPKYAGLRGRLRFLVSPLAIVDLIAIVPGLIPGTVLDLRFARALRLLRLARALKLARYSKSVQLFLRVLGSRRSQLGLASFTGALLLLCAACGIYFLEHDAQPDRFPSIPASVWWGVMTLTTVGYGDVYPITPGGKLLAGVVAVLGIGMFALPAGILAGGFSEEIERERQGPKRCPHCGETLDS